MAKPEKKTAAKPAAKEKVNADAYKFTVDDLADALGIEPASARIKLRNAEIEKAPTGRYGWKTKADMQEVIDELKPEKKAAPKKEAAKAKGKSAPAKSSGKRKGGDDD